MKVTALLFSCLFIAFLAWLLLSPSSIILSICITLGVIAYHFAMRLIVGTSIDLIFHNKMNYNLFWFRQRKFEKKLYKLLRVRKWTKKIPTYSPDTFSVEKHSWKEIAMATCQSEIVHELIILFSLLPILLIIPFGTPLVFVLTSIASCFIDATFVIVQRYNRPKLIAYITKLDKKISQKKENNHDR